MALTPLPPRPPELEDDADARTLVTRIGSAVACGSLAALLSSVPAALRLSHERPVALTTAWLALAALALPHAIVCVTVLRRAVHGLRALLGPHAGVRGGALLSWLGLQLAALGVLGTVLRASTHHRPLGGATLAIAAVTFALASGAVLARFAGDVAAAHLVLRRAVLVLGALLAAGMFAICALALARAADTPPLVTAAIVDVLALCVASAAFAGEAFAWRRPLALAGPPAAVLVLALGVLAMRHSVGVGDAIREGAPMHTILAPGAR